MNTKSRERLLAKIEQRSPEECWPWIGGMGSWGYGSFWLGGKNLNSSRAAYMLLVGPIPDGLSVCHSCDNPPCCNPAHLWLGTQGDNIRDCKKKGRSRGLFSQKPHPRYMAKLSVEQIERAWQLYASGIPQTHIAREYGVDSSTICRAIQRLTARAGSQ